MKNVFLFFFVTILFSFLLSCGFTEYISLDETSYAPVKDCYHFKPGDTIPYQFEIIGLVKSKRSPTEITQDDIKDLINIGSVNGADGIIDLRKDGKMCSAKAIRFKRDENGDFIRK